MRGSAQPAGAHNPLGTLLVNGPRSRGAWARGPRVGGEESPREPDGEDESLEEVCAPSLPPRGHPGQVFRRAPGPAPRRGLNCAERAAGGGGGGQKGSARGSLPNPQGRGEAELRDPPSQQVPGLPHPQPQPTRRRERAGRGPRWKIKPGWRPLSQSGSRPAGFGQWPPRMLMSADATRRVHSKSRSYCCGRLRAPAGPRRRAARGPRPGRSRGRRSRGRSPAATAHGRSRDGRAGPRAARRARARH